MPFGDSVGPTLAASLEYFAHGLNLFLRHYFGRCLSDVTEIFPL